MTLSLANDGVFGTDAIVQDSVSGLDWLRLHHTFDVYGDINTPSVGWTFPEMSGMFGVGGNYEGWRHATTAEISGMFSEGGVSSLYTYNSGSSATLEALVDLIGFTGLFDASTQSYACAHASDEQTFGSLRCPALLTQGYLHDSGQWLWHARDGSVQFQSGVQGASQVVGHFLVR